MSNIGKIKIKTFAELQATTGINVEPEPPPITEDRTPEKKRAGKTRAATTTKKVQAKSEPNGGVIVASTAIKRSNKKTPLPGQLRIDSFFKSAAKSYKVNMVPVPRSSAKAMDAPAAKRKVTSRGRKRLFDESTTTSTTSTDTLGRKPPEKRVQPGRRAKGKENTNLPEELDVIDLCSEDEGDKTIKAEPPAEAYSSPVRNSIPAPKLRSSKRPSSSAVVKTSPGTKRPSAKTSPGNKRISVKTSPDPSMAAIPRDSSLPKNSKKGAGRKQKTPKPCPPYKIVEGTSFCVDGFQFGDIDGVSHYFLTHYHADHYIGLTKNFCYPLYMSPTTARLVRTFIKVDEMCINEIEVDQTLMVDGVQVTALEANHCPGALLFFFQLPSGKNILHTGDFRACAEMESWPIFWNHTNIDLLYLDTTYMNKNYDFCHQTESVDRAIELVRDFKEKNLAKRILFVCGSYVIGKEKIWLALAKEFNLRVWTEENRSKAIKCMNWLDLESVLTDDPRSANLHILPMGKISYPSLVEYLSQFEDQYDMLLGIRPSGWEKNSKPSYGKRISTIGIEYSEHSSYKELERFVRFLKPKRVLSTVPVGRDLFVTGDVPTEWYKYEGRSSMLSTGYQPSISSFLATPKRIVPKMTAATAMSVSPADEKASNGKGDGGEDDWQTAVPADHITILSSTSEKKSEILVKNEPLGPDTCPETEIITWNETLEPEMSYDIDIVIKNESMPPDSCPVTQPYAPPTEAEESKDNPGISKDSGGPCTIVIPDSQEQNKDDGSTCGAVLVSRLTSDATDDWLL
ncbi:DNA cross-link repair 1A protein [Drosophila elegans]|uniref:DNA cross-link repair 1A protein n=1 Tax=Drosophila elegans TaxID=30023 RepID=UPI0007E6F621|nr:DNA cross-link repair 1A protein [Drosophila elegans]